MKIRQDNDSLPCKVCCSPSEYLLSLPNTHSETTSLDVYVCSSCDLVFVGNDLGDDELAAAYQTLDSKSYYETMAREARAKAAESSDSILDLMSHKSGPDSLLDIGCGYGHLLEEMEQKGEEIRLSGYELAGEEAELCRSKGFQPEFPISSCMDPSTSPYSTRAILVLLTNAVNLPIKLTKPSGVVNVCSMGSGGGFHYVHPI